MVIHSGHFNPDCYAMFKFCFDVSVKSKLVTQNKGVDEMISV